MYTKINKTTSLIKTEITIITNCGLIAFYRILHTFQGYYISLHLEKLYFFEFLQISLVFADFLIYSILPLQIIFSITFSNFNPKLLNVSLKALFFNIIDDKIADKIREKNLRNFG